MGLFGRKKGVHAGRASALIEEGAVVVDVREQAEWDAGHIPGAIHLPLGEIAQGHNQLPLRHSADRCLSQRQPQRARNGIVTQSRAPC